jgi:hypothetical protein
LLRLIRATKAIEATVVVFDAVPCQDGASHEKDEEQRERVWSYALVRETPYQLPLLFKLGRGRICLAFLPGTNAQNLLQSFVTAHPSLAGKWPLWQPSSNVVSGCRWWAGR